MNPITNEVMERLLGKDGIYDITLGDSHIRISTGPYIITMATRQPEDIFNTAIDTPKGKVEVIVEGNSIMIQNRALSNLLVGHDFYQSFTSWFKAVRGEFIRVETDHLIFKLED